jgi:hypothetical protein
MGLLAPPWAIRKGLEKALVGLSAEQLPQALAFALSEAKTTAQKVALMASITQHLAFEGNGAHNLCMYTCMLLPVTGHDPMDSKLIKAAGLLRDAAKKILRVVGYMSVEDVMLLTSNKTSPEVIRNTNGGAEDAMGNYVLQIGACLALSSLGVHCLVHTRSMDCGMSVGDLLKVVDGSSPRDSVAASPQALLATAPVNVFLELDGPDAHYRSSISKGPLPGAWLPKGVIPLEILTNKLQALLTSDDEDIKQIINLEVAAAKQYAHVARPVSTDGQVVPGREPELLPLPTHTGQAVTQNWALLPLSRAADTAKGLQVMHARAAKAWGEVPTTLAEAAAKRTVLATKAVEQGKAVRTAAAKVKATKEPEAAGLAKKELASAVKALAFSQKLLEELKGKIARLRSEVTRPTPPPTASAEAMRAAVEEERRKAEASKATAATRAAAEKERKKARKAMAMRANAEDMAELDRAMALAKAEEAELARDAAAAKAAQAQTGRAGVDVDMQNNAPTHDEDDRDSDVEEVPNTDVDGTPQRTATPTRQGEVHVTSPPTTGRYPMRNKARQTGQHTGQVGTPARKPTGAMTGSPGHTELPPVVPGTAKRSRMDLEGTTTGAPATTAENPAATM